jgi:GntR family transcriptional repressor for pyruvate dehydrogenase complex
MSERAALQVAEELRSLLMSGRYAPGERLPAERELAARLGVSRPTAREAIGHLTEAGLVQARRGSGTYVTTVDVRALLEVRLQLEPFAAELAAGRRDQAQVQQLRKLLGELGAAVDEPARFGELDALLHQAVWETAGNPVLHETLDRLSGLALLSRAVTTADPKLRRATLKQMRRLVRAIAGRDTTAARSAMAQHLEEIAASAPPDQSGLTTLV